jgi:uncharacterized protein
MIRFALSPEGQVVPDLRGTLPGRGVWVGCHKTLVEKAVKRGLFAKGFKKQAVASAQLADEIEGLMLGQIKNALSLANKAGAALCGFTKVEDAIRTGKAVAVLHARAAGAEGQRKLAAALQASGAAVPVITDLSEAELGLAFGRPDVIHAVLVAGHGSTGFMRLWRRLCLYRTDEA